MGAVDTGPVAAGSLVPRPLGAGSVADGSRSQLAYFFLVFLSPRSVSAVMLATGPCAAGSVAAGSVAAGSCAAGWVAAGSDAAGSVAAG